MKHMEKLFATLVALAILSTGAGTQGVRAQNVAPDVNAGVKTLPSGDFGLGGLQGGGLSVSAQIQGATLRGTVLGGSAGPFVSRNAPISTLSVAPGLQAEASVAAVGVIPVGRGAREYQKQIGSASVMKEEAKFGASGLGAPSMAASRVSGEQAAYQGQIQFDVAAMMSSAEGPSPAAVSEGNSRKTAPALARPAPAAPKGGFGRSDDQYDLSGFSPQMIRKFQDGGSIRMGGQIVSERPNIWILYDDWMYSQTRGKFFIVAQGGVHPPTPKRLMTEEELRELKGALQRFLGTKQRSLIERERELYQEILNKITLVSGENQSARHS